MGYRCCRAVGRLLLLGGVHVPLAADDQLGALHRAVAPDLGVVAVVADDERDLEPLRADAHLPCQRHLGCTSGTPRILSPFGADAHVRRVARVPGEGMQGQA